MESLVLLLGFAIEAVVLLVIKQIYSQFKKIKFILDIHQRGLYNNDNQIKKRLEKMSSALMTLQRITGAER